MNRRQLYSYIQEIIDEELVYILINLNERTNSRFRCKWFKKDVGGMKICIMI